MTINDSGTSRNRLYSFIGAALILAVGVGYGLSLVGSGLSAKAGNAITVTGSARVSAVADNVVWTLNANETSQSASAAVKKVEKSVAALRAYLIAGTVPESAIESGGVGTQAINEYINGNPTGRVLNYQANQSVVVRSKDVQLIKKLSNNLGQLLQTGVNISNYGPAYYVSSLASLRPKLLADAMKDAKVRAEAVTKAVGGSVGAVMSVTSGPFQVTAPDSVDTSSGGYYDTSSIDKTVTATVSVSFKVSN